MAEDDARVTQAAQFMSQFGSEIQKAFPKQYDNYSSEELSRKLLAEHPVYFGQTVQKIFPGDYDHINPADIAQRFVEKNPEWRAATSQGVDATEAFNKEHEIMTGVEGMIRPVADTVNSVMGLYQRNVTDPLAAGHMPFTHQGESQGTFTRALEALPYATTIGDTSPRAKAAVSGATGFLGSMALDPTQVALMASGAGLVGKAAKAEEGTNLLTKGLGGAARLLASKPSLIANTAAMATGVGDSVARFAQILEQNKYQLTPDVVKAGTQLGLSTVAMGIVANAARKGLLQKAATPKPGTAAPGDTGIPGTGAPPPPPKGGGPQPSAPGPSGPVIDMKQGPGGVWEGPQGGTAPGVTKALPPGDKQIPIPLSPQVGPPGEVAPRPTPLEPKALPASPLDSYLQSLPQALRSGEKGRGITVKGDEGYSRVSQPSVKHEFGLGDFNESPKVLAAAIERGKGPLYDRVRAAVQEHLSTMEEEQNLRRQAPSPENNVPDAPKAPWRSVGRGFLQEGKPEASQVQPPPFNGPKVGLEAVKAPETSPPIKVKGEPKVESVAVSPTTPAEVSSRPTLGQEKAPFLKTNEQQLLNNLTEEVRAARDAGQPTAPIFKKYEAMARAQKKDVSAQMAQRNQQMGAQIREAVKSGNLEEAKRLEAQLKGEIGEAQAKGSKVRSTVYSDPNYVRLSHGDKVSFKTPDGQDFQGQIKQHVGGKVKVEGKNGKIYVVDRASISKISGEELTPKTSLIAGNHVLNIWESSSGMKIADGMDTPLEEDRINQLLQNPHIPMILDTARQASKLFQEHSQKLATEPHQLVDDQNSHVAGVAISPVLGGLRTKESGDIYISPHGLTTWVNKEIADGRVPYQDRGIALATHVFSTMAHEWGHGFDPSHGETHLNTMRALADATRVIRHDILMNGENIERWTQAFDGLNQEAQGLYAEYQRSKSGGPLQSTRPTQPENQQVSPERLAQPVSAVSGESNGGAPPGNPTESGNASNPPQNPANLAGKIDGAVRRMQEMLLGLHIPGLKALSDTDLYALNLAKLAVFDPLSQHLTGKDVGAQSSDAIWNFRAGWRSLKEAQEAFSKGFDMPTKVGSLLGIGTKTLRGTAEFYRVLGRESALDTMFRRMGTRQGLKGDDLESFIMGASESQRKFNQAYEAALAEKDPADRLAAMKGLRALYSQDWFERGNFIKNESARAALIEPLKKNSFGEWAGKPFEGFGEKGSMTKAVTHAIGKMLAPFTHVPGNMVNRNFEHFPTEVLRAVYADKSFKTPTERIDAMSKGLMGATLLAMGYALAGTKTITSGPPPSWEEEQNRRATGWAPYAIRMAGKYREGLDRLPVLGSFLVLGADIRDLAQRYDEMKKDGTLDPKQAEKDWRDLKQRALATVVHFGTPHYIPMMNNLIVNLENGRLDKIGMQYVGDVIPAISREIAQAIDPTARQGGTLKQTVERNIPGMSQNVPPQRDWTGKPVQKNEGNFLERLVGFWKTSQDHPENVVASEFDRLHIEPPMEPRKYKNEKLSPEQYANLEGKLGGNYQDVFQAIVTSPGYRLAPDPVKRRILEEQKSRLTKAAAVKGEAYRQLQIQP